MATANEIEALVRAWARRDDDMFVRMVRVMSANARRGGKPSPHADRLDGLVGVKRAALEAPKDKDSGMALGRFREASVSFDAMALNAGTTAATEQFLAEVAVWSKLEERGIRRRNRVLLHGPAGCGKSSFASALAERLDRELLVVETAAITGSLLGQTSKNISALFDFLEHGSYVVLFDEFDSLGRDRSAEHEHGEIRRATNVLLQKIEEYTGDSIVVAATNHEGLLDDALWRRFDFVTELPLPSQAERAAILDQLNLGDEALIDEMATRLDGLSHAAAAYARDSAWRLALTHGRERPGTDDLRVAVAGSLERRWTGDRR